MVFGVPVANSRPAPTNESGCSACKSDRQEELYSINNCRIIRCRDCGLGRAQPSRFDPSSYYTGDYFDGGRQDGYLDYESSADILGREFRGVVDELVAKIPERARLLEVGCAYGYFLKEASRAFDVVGIEIAQAAVDGCHQAGLENVLCGAIDLVNLEELGNFDAVVMLDVIEHLENPRRDLERLAGVLKPGGVVLLSTGDFSSLLARLMRSKWRLMTPPQHLWFFTPKAIEGLALQCGLKVEEVRYPW
jgi:SAM-dependent methyltransferase